jgi:hypothetical protein
MTCMGDTHADGHREQYTESKPAPANAAETRLWQQLLCCVPEVCIGSAQMHGCCFITHQVCAFRQVLISIASLHPQVHVNTLDMAAVSPMVYKLLSSGRVERLPALGTPVRAQ